MLTGKWAMTLPASSWASSTWSLQADMQELGGAARRRPRHGGHGQPGRRRHGRPVDPRIELAGIETNLGVGVAAFRHHFQGWCS